MPTAETKPLVLLFEDDPKDGKVVEKAIRAAVSRRFAFHRFADVRDNSTNGGAYEDLLFAELMAPKFKKLQLIVSDRDLSKSARFPGLSEAVVSKVAARLGVPICIYAAGQMDSVIERQRSGGDGRLILDSQDKDAMGRTVAVIAAGFLDVSTKLASREIASLKRRAQGPATIMGSILDRPELADQLSLYATGDQKMIAELMPVSGTGQDPYRKRRLHTVLGYWLYDSVLRFPGILVNEIAAASYLNIAPTAFAKPKVQAIFSRALYGGPFADSAKPRWWRDRLDDLIQAASVLDGKSLAEGKLGRRLKPCLCSVDAKTRAGFYCVISHKPVSQKNSRGNISWLPRGADLARVRNDLYDELAPWIGLR